MRILITGAAGMLGTAVRAEFHRLGHHIIATSLTGDEKEISSLDIRDWRVVRQCLKEHRPEIVLHLAAETDVDRCELEPDHAYATNAMGTENVVWGCIEQGSTMVYISTAGVFDGQKVEPYTEYDRPNPINVYGRSKLEGERIVENTLDRYFIFRAGWMVGGWEIDKKFVYKIVQQCRTAKQLKVVNDKFGSPTFTVDFAGNLMNIVETQRYGLYHMTNKGVGSRYDIAKEIVAHLGLIEEVEVCPISSSEFPLPAERARSEMMRNFKLDLLGLNNMPHWKESLQNYILKNKKNWQRERV